MSKFKSEIVDVLRKFVNENEGMKQVVMSSDKYKELEDSLDDTTLVKIVDEEVDDTDNEDVIEEDVVSEKVNPRITKGKLIEYVIKNKKI